MIDTLKQNPGIKHGNTPSPLPGRRGRRRIDKFEIEKWGAKFAYTVDGEQLGDISNETGLHGRRLSRSTARNTHRAPQKG
jgi:tripeptide aminopeptidase